VDEIKAKYLEYLTTQEVAEKLRVAPETVRYWTWRGEGPPSFKIGRRRLYPAEGVEAYIAAARAAGDGAA
jgi:excisionase family DNA binding protein